MPSTEELRVAALLALGEEGGITSKDVGLTAWGEGATPRQAAKRADALLVALAREGVAALLDDQRPKAWVRTWAGTAELVRLGLLDAEGRPAPRAA